MAKLGFSAARTLGSLSLSGLVGVSACSTLGDMPSDGGCEGSLYTSWAVTTLPCTEGSLIGDGHGNTLKTFCPPPDPGSNKIYVSASGETLSLVGFPFPPAPAPNNTFMVDGWNFELTAYITAITAITLWTDPDESPGNQLLHGPEVAQLNGPFIVDLHKGGILPGQAGSGEQATPIGVLSGPSSGGAFDPTTTYAFGFSTVAAPSSYDAFNVNLDVTEAPYYEYMVQNGYSVLYVGTATWAGNQPWENTANGTQPPPSPAGSLEPKGAYCSVTSVTPPYSFEEPPYPTTMQFWLGFSTPTNYVNCQNGSEFPGQMGIAGEDHPRGIQTSTYGSVPAQVTIHMDHPFWESFTENSPLHWDQIASQFMNVKGPMVCDPTMPSGGPTCVHTEDLKTLGGIPGMPALNFTAFEDANAKPLPFRNCVSTTGYMAPGSGQMFFNPLKVSVCTSGQDSPDACLGSYYDFIRYSQSTQGHLNSQGFCFIDRQYPSPGGG
jgi:hypothetical protein